MAEELVFPRLIYRGLPDHLGQGEHLHPETDEKVGETKRVNSQDELDAAIADGWRLTRADPETDPADDAGGDASAAGDAPTAKAKAAKAKGKK